jgi:hypothetical protein
MNTRVLISLVFLGLIGSIHFANACALPTKPADANLFSSTCFKSDADTLRVDAGPDQRMCAGQSVQLNASPCTRGFTYRWSPAIGLSDSSSCNPTARPERTTTYTVTMSDGTNSAQDVVMVTVLPAPAVTASARNISCRIPGSIRLAFTSGTPPFQISGDLMIGNIQTNPFEYEVSRPRLFRLTVTDGNGCTLSLEPINVQQTVTTLRIRSISVPASVGTEVGVLRIRASGGTPPYNYSIDGGNSWFGTSTFNVRAGIYDLRVGDAAGCGVKRVDLFIK